MKHLMYLSITILCLSLTLGCGGEDDPMSSGNGGNGQNTTAQFTDQWFARDTNRLGESEAYIYYFADGRYLRMYAYDSDYPTTGSLFCDNVGHYLWELVGADKIVFRRPNGDLAWVEYIEIEDLGSAGYRLLRYKGEDGVKGELNFVYYPVDDISAQMRTVCCDQWVGSDCP